MKELKRKKNITLFFALLTSIGLPLSIPAIVFGAVFQLWILMGAGILVAFVSFYGCPLLWVSYAKKRHTLSLATKIECDKVLSIDKLASIFNMDIANALNEVRDLIAKRYISNYLIDEEKRVLYINEVEKKVVTFFCPSCGASLVRNDTNKYVCDYCHTSFEYK